MIAQAIRRVLQTVNCMGAVEFQDVFGKDHGAYLWEKYLDVFGRNSGDFVLYLDDKNISLLIANALKNSQRTDI